MKFYKKFVTENNLENVKFEPRPEAVRYQQFQSNLWSLLAAATEINDFGDEVGSRLLCSILCV